jgi:ribosomal protein S17E
LIERYFYLLSYIHIKIALENSLIIVSAPHRSRIMKFLEKFRRYLVFAALIATFALTTACASVAPPSARVVAPSTATNAYGQLTRGSSTTEQNFGDWVVQTSKGLVSDAFVRDKNKLGVVISSQVRPNEVKELAKSLMQGFHKSFPNQDLKVLMYAPDKKLILTSLYDVQSKKIDFQVPS